ncbi:hypothetical protein EV421DRAFT_1792957 [Armillaria borealis]|uniref:Zn(2)-C6 fungal-type domain-containing protein n=1 Tax=Armillaria borealis TaxID=47425 RepID=A0AA39MUE8_9AGAR|nr:hypothetical protein EV421DRAFT_1792957 [Armillaria borealis]
MEVTKDLPPDGWPDDFKLASMVLDLLEKRSTQSLMLNGQQPLGGLDPSELSRPTTSRKRTIDDPACIFCRGRKIRCDAKRPACSVCLRRNLECIIEAYSRLLTNDVGKDGVALPERGGSGPSLVACSSSYDGNTAWLNPLSFVSPVPSGPSSPRNSNPPQPLTLHGNFNEYTIDAVEPPGSSGMFLSCAFVEPSIILFSRSELAEPNFYRG